MTDTGTLSGLAGAFLAILANRLLWLAVPVALTLGLVRLPFWARFTEKHRLGHCAVFVFLSLWIVSQLLPTAPLFLLLLPGKIRIESPNLTAMTLKSAAYEDQIGQALAKRLAPEKRGAIGCVRAISADEIRHAAQPCTETSCVAPPTMKRETILQKIRESQAAPTHPAYAACKDVDVDKL